MALSHSQYDCLGAANGFLVYITLRQFTKNKHKKVRKIEFFSLNFLYFH